MFGKVPFPGPSFAQMCDQKQLPLRVSFWTSDLTRYGEMSAFLPSPEPLSPWPKVTTSPSKWHGKKKFFDCDLVHHVPDEIDREYKVTRWPELNDLLQMLLHPRPFSRPSAGQAKHHPWVTSNGVHPVRNVQYKS